MPPDVTAKLIYNYFVIRRVEINGNEYPEEDARRIVLKMLDEFNGFDANGFFTLGKPFLVNVFATVVISYALLLTEFHFSPKL